MDYWAWGGKYIGFSEGGWLYSKKGKPIGYFRGDDIFSSSGRYLGEVKDNDKLIVDKNKKHCIASCSTKPCARGGRSYCNYVGCVMLSGYEDFKVPEE